MDFKTKQRLTHLIMIAGVTTLFFCITLLQNDCINDISLKSLSENPRNRGTADCRVREKSTQGRPADEELVGFRIGSKAESGQIDGWDDVELKVIQHFSLRKLSAPHSISILGKEIHKDDPIYQLGKALFSDTRLSKDMRTSCATCHEPDRAFSSSLIVETEAGGPRNVPSLLGVGSSKFFFWDGRADSLWSQAIGPLTSQNEHNLSIEEILTRVAQFYEQEYKLAFAEGIPLGVKTSQSEVVTHHFKNVLTAIAGFESFILPQEAKIERYIEFLEGPQQTQKAVFTECEVAGLKLFIGRGLCSNCHFGPLFSNQFFQNVGVPMVSDTDKNIGFANRFGMRVYNPWRCELHSHDPEAECSHVLNMDYQGAMVHSFKTPTLRAIGQTPPYGHNGAFKSLEEVVEHYSEPNDLGVQDFDIDARNFTPTEKKNLVCFLKTL